MKSPFREKSVAGSVKKKSHKHRHRKGKRSSNRIKKTPTKNDIEDISASE
jgi:hypothetical protein